MRAAGSVPRRAHWRARDGWPLILGLAALLYGTWLLLAMGEGVSVARERSGDLPVVLHWPAASGMTSDAPSVPLPTVVIAHGFAGSHQLMRSFALNLARHGYLAVSFDFPGHGAHRAPLGGGLGSPQRLASLLEALAGAVAVAERANPGAPLALLGHSMAGDVLVQYAKAHPVVVALVAVSPYLSEPIGAEFSPNLLLVYGAHEPEMIHQQGREAMAEVLSEPAASATTFGDPREGGARRLVMADGVEHIGVLFSGQAVREAVVWLDASFGRESLDAPSIRTAGAGLAWFYLGLCLLAWPLSLLLPPMADRPLGAGLGWRGLVPVALVPALLTPVLLWPLPSDFLPLLLGDYLALHFLVYGLLTWGGLALRGALVRRADVTHAGSRAVLAVGVLAWLAFAVGGFGWPTQQLVAGFFPPPERLPSLLALLLGSAVYASADAWLVHGQAGARGAGVLTKLMFLLSLALAVALKLEELFFLVIIFPAIVILFVVYGWLDFLAYRRTWQPLLGAAASALVFALAITATFPVVA